MQKSDDIPECVRTLLADAAESGCTDLYIVPDRDMWRVRRRTPTTVEDVQTLSPDEGTQCVARIKVLAGIPTYRTSVAQDGAIRAVPDVPDVEFRVATLPTASGERVTVRLLTRPDVPRHLGGLGFTESTLKRLRSMLRRPTGLVVLTGPTGSGKTTTMYAMLRELLADGHSPSTMITIEDPIESELPGVSQVQVLTGDEKWDYARALRAALRHDVKTLLIGELRDREVTRVALDAALTGHRVITTFHAGDIASVYARMLHQGFEPFLVAAAISGVVSQRLVPAADGHGIVPVAAVLAVDDSWREFVLEQPGLRELRSHLAGIPGADLPAEAKLLADEGRIRKEDVILL